MSDEPMSSDELAHFSEASRALQEEVRAKLTRRQRCFLSDVRELTQLVVGYQLPVFMEVPEAELPQREQRLDDAIRGASGLSRRDYALLFLHELASACALELGAEAPSAWEASIVDSWGSDVAERLRECSIDCPREFVELVLAIRAVEDNEKPSRPKMEVLVDLAASLGLMTRNADPENVARTLRRGKEKFFLE